MYDRQSTDIEKITQDYQEFAYIVSHDLAAPLRHIKEFTKLLVSARSQSALSDEERSYIDFLDMSLQRLDVMQQALIEFSQAHSAGKSYAPLNPHLLLDDVLRSFENQTIILCVEIPNIQGLTGYTEHIKFVFKALINNSLQFKDPERDLKLEISMVNRGDYVDFCFKDNGIGIAPAHVETVFKMFRKLGIDDQHHHAGAGLTIARKIVESHGGAIWIEPNKEHGVSVFVRLPLA